MKKLSIVVLGAMLLSSGQSAAQLLKAYGVKLALTSSSQNFTYPHPPFPGFGPDLKRRIGFGIALYAEWLNLPFVSILSQVEYAQRGCGEELAVTGPDGPAVIRTEVFDKRLDYLSIPILVKSSVPLGKVTPYILVGPRVDVLLGYRDESGGGNSIYQDFKKTSLGGSIGAGFELADVLPFRISMEFRCNIDFGDSYDTSLLKVRNNAYDIWVGVAP